MTPRRTRIAAASALALGVLVVFFLVTTSGSNGYELRATFDDVRGLIPGGEVRAGAIKVGTVDDIALDDRNRPVVSMKVSDDFRLHEGAKANIKLGSNAGVVNRVVELTQGDTTAPTLPRDATLSGTQTDQPVNFDEAMQTLNPPTRRNLKRFLVGLQAGTEGRGDDVMRMLRHAPAAANETANVLEQVNEDGAALRTLVRQGDRVVSALASNPQDIGEATELTARLLRTTARRQAELRRSIDLLAPALAGGRGLLQRVDRAVPNLRRLLTGLTPVVDELGPFSREVPPAVAAAVPFLRQARRLVEQIPGDLTRLKPIMRAAEPVTATLAPVAESAMPFLETLRAYGPDVVGAFQNLGSVVGGYDANGHVLNVFGAVAPALSTTSNTISPSDCTPGLVARPYLRVPGAAECQPWPGFEDTFLGAPGG